MLLERERNQGELYCYRDKKVNTKVATTAHVEVMTQSGGVTAVDVMYKEESATVWGKLSLPPFGTAPPAAKLPVDATPFRPLR